MKESLDRYFYKPKGLLRVFGPDAAGFLQGQFSNDLSGEAGKCVYGYWLNRKGKVLADSFVLKESEETFWLVSYECLSAVIAERLDSYIIMDDVEVEILSEAYGAFSVWGEDLESAALPNEVDVPAQGEFSSFEGGFCFRGVRGGGFPSIEIVQIADSGASVLDVLARDPGIHDLTSMDVDNFSIVEDRPIPPRAFGETDLPQETSMGIDAISYNKGCYLGQEVMARIKSMGRVRRQLIPAQLNGLISVGTESREVKSSAGIKVGDFRALTNDGVDTYGFVMLKSGQRLEDCHLEGLSGNFVSLREYGAEDI